MNLAQKIGFDRVQAQVKALCTNLWAEEKLLEHTFSTDKSEIYVRLIEAFELRNALMMETGFPSHEFVDSKQIFAKVIIEGSFLEAEELSELRDLLDTVHEIKLFFDTKDGYPTLREKSERINSFSDIRNHINTIIDKSSNVLDSASSELYAIRRAIREQEGQANKRLQQVLSQAIASGVVEADAAVSVREGRPVIPVTAANKRKLRGFIHDESATGKTVFIEPVEVVEINNALKELEYAQRREIIRILTEFTHLLRPDVEDVKALGDFIAHMDMLRAKARFALSNGCSMPIISHSRELNLRSAVHPLLAQALAKENKSVVPLDIRLDAENRILLISGPNAGGKSVCLKTVGLLQYMLQCGYLVSVGENSEMMLFDRIFIDIGDEQSLDNDLSTYSSHLFNMKELLGSTSNCSLVLIDEFGTGTEPIIGGAIAEAILEKLVEKSCFGVITTHYSNLKYYASNAEGIINAGMMFDVQNIRPLFMLEMGTPGSSFAVEIARKIGLPHSIIASAMEKAGSDHMKVEKLLREIARDKRYWEQKRDRIRIAERKIEQLEQKYSTELLGIKQERSRIMKEAKVQAQEVVSQANKHIENTIKTIKESQADKDKTRFVRKNIDDFKQQLQEETVFNDDAKITEQMNKVIERQKRRQEKKKNAPVVSAEIAEVKKLIKPIEVGSKVRIKEQDTIGEVMSLKGAKVEVSFGHLKTFVPKDRLVLVSQAEFKKQSRPTSSRIVVSERVEERKLKFKQSIDVRGMRASEALEEVQNYIDDALMVGVSQVRILHGKGSGALLTEIRRYLKTVSAIVSAEDEHIEMGGSGITVVKFFV